MTRWTPFRVPPVPVGKRPKDEAVPRLARYDRLEVWLLRIAAAGLVVTVLLTLDLLRSLP